MTSDGDLTVWENLSIYSKLYGIPSADREKSIDELLELVDLNQWRDAPARNLSGGMRRRLEIARGLVHRPRIFFLDEPTTGLDPVSRVAVWEMITSIKQKRNLTVLVTTHYMDEADRLCDRIAIVDHGKLVALDTPHALKNSIPGSSVIEAQFLAASRGLAADAGRPGRRELGAAGGRGHVSHPHRRWIEDHNRTGGNRRARQRCGKNSYRPEHDAG